MSTSFIFPGQGSQFIGMGKEHFKENKVFRSFCEDANKILDFDLTEIMFEGPEEKLKQTEYTQPSIFLHSVALFKMLNKKPDMVAGHSLGEFSALVACGAVSFKAALKTVRKRGELMQQAGESNPGTMAAVIGMEDDKVDQLCEEASGITGKEVIAANYNCPGQLVISGYVEAVEKAVELAKDKGCRLARVLPVSGAFHSSLMKPAYEGLKGQLWELDIQQAECPIYQNYTAKPTTDAAEIRENLLEQLLNPVRWTNTIKNMYNAGATSFVEVGPGKVLQGLVKRTLEDVEIKGYQ